MYVTSVRNSTLSKLDILLVELDQTPFFLRSEQTTVKFEDLVPSIRLFWII